MSRKDDFRISETKEKRRSKDRDIKRRENESEG